MTKRRQWAAPVTKVKPEKAWAEISDDNPPEIWKISWWKSELRDDLRHIRVMVTPIERKKTRKMKP